jgi:hypothetical protein
MVKLQVLKPVACRICWSACVCAGAKVLDLGCVPGAWMQVACQQIGPHDRGGLVLGVDIQEVCCAVLRWALLCLCHRAAVCWCVSAQLACAVLLLALCA